MGEEASQCRANRDAGISDALSTVNNGTPKSVAL